MPRERFWFLYCLLFGDGVVVNRNFFSLHLLLRRVRCEISSIFFGTLITVVRLICDFGGSRKDTVIIIDKPQI